MDITIEKLMLPNYDRVKKLLGRISCGKVGLIGDACVDIYWKADMTKSELSRETPHYPLPIVEESFSGGAAANVAANMWDNGISEMYFLSIIANDWRGFLLKQALNEKGIKTDMLLENEEMITPAYCKPIRGGISHVLYEDPRLDFENQAPIPEQIEDRILRRLEKLTFLCPVIAVSDQFKNGIITPRIRQRINEYGQEGIKFVVDSRYHVDEYENVIVKPNEVELCRALSIDNNSMTIDGYANSARMMYKKTLAPVIVTLGALGSILYDGKMAFHCESIESTGEIDIVGAGDSFLSLLAAALGSGINLAEAMCLAHFAAAITIKKLNTTGTANQDEILELAKIHEPK